MNPINALGLKVVGLTSVIIMLLGGLVLAGKYGLQQYHQETPVKVAQDETLLGSTRTDSDGDNLPDQFEPVYRTDPRKADTDGDGVNDFEEIQQGQDPAIAGSQDANLPATGRNVTNPVTVTEQYLASLPEDIPSEEILSQARLAAFVNLNKGTLIPPVPPEFIRSSATSGKAAIETYLDAISAAHNPQLHAVTNTDIEAAFTLHTQKQPQRLAEVATQLQKNVELLRAIEAPAEAVALHTQLVSASQALADNVKRLQTTSTDFVNGLIGSKNIEELGAVFQDIANQVKALETKHGIV